MPKTFKRKKIAALITKKSAIYKVLKEKKSVTRVATELGVSRKAIYAWIKRFKLASPRNKDKAYKPLYRSGREHPNAIYPRAKNKLIRLAFLHPEWGCRRLSKELASKGINISYFSVNNFLKKLDFSTPELRMNIQNIYKGPGRLSDDIKLEIVKKVFNKEINISEAARKYDVSRKVVHKWIKMYQLASNNGTFGSKIFKDNYVKGENHPLAKYPSFEKSVLEGVAKEPRLSVHKLSEKFPISSWTIWNILNRNGLNSYEARKAFSQSFIPEKGFIKPVTFVDRIRSVFERFTPTLAPAPPPSLIGFVKTFSVSSLVSFLISLGFLNWFSILSGASTLGFGIGLIFSSFALLFGTFFFLYSLKYYLSMTLVLSFSQQENEEMDLRNNGLVKRSITNWLLNVITGGEYEGSSERGNIRKVVGLQANLDHINLTRYPYISVQIPFYNEKNVVERSIAASTNFDYRGEYEVILCDDSTDETTNIIQSYIKSLKHAIKVVENTEDGWILTTVEVREGVTLKHLHRTTRSGFKGGALKLALTLCDPKTEFVSIFDADFVPYPDSLDLFLKYFKLQNGMKENYTNSNVAAVQGYQWHVLNKSENWITRGVRSEYAGSYVIERSGTEIYSGLKQISGSVYMVRRDALESVGWGTSITEDFELTLKLYNAGYKVVYTPYIQAPAECVSTLKRLIRQRMRWSEGHSQNIKRMFFKLLLNPNLKLSEKFELLYLSPYYLQAFFFLFGTLSWLLAETVFQARLPFWTELWGWSLVFTNLFALPLMNATGLFLEESEEKDYQGLVSFIVLSYIVVPFQAYAALRGFFEQTEGPWFRTPKTGRITDIFQRGMFSRFVQGLLGGKEPSIVQTSNYKLQVSNYLALTTANSKFDNFDIKPGRNRWLGKSLVSFILVLAIFINAVTFNQGFNIFFHSKLDNLTNTASKVSINGKDTYSMSEAPKFQVKLPESKKTSFIDKIFGKGDVYAANPNLSVTLLNYNNQEEKDVKPNFYLDSNNLKITLPEADQLRPGKYTLKVKGEYQGKRIDSTQDFRWGVLAINTNKSIYLQGEMVHLGFGVLDDQGRTICDTSLKLQIINNQQQINEELSTENGKIKQSGKCNSNSVTNVADYLTDYQIQENSLGTYELHLIAENQNGERSVDDVFEVKQSVPFDIERTSYPTRIYPAASYNVSLSVRVNQDYKGEVREYVPKSFEITNFKNQVSNKFQITNLNKQKELIWNVDWHKGEIHQLEYSIKFPNASPQFYLVGPLKIGDFSEVRSWQIASDATILFMESGTDATQDLKFWDLTHGTVSSSTTTVNTGPRSILFNPSSGVQADVEKNGVLGLAGRITAYVNMSAFPSSTAALYDFDINSQFTYYLCLTSGGVLQLNSGNTCNTSQLGSNGSTLSTGTWYRLSVTWNITNQTTFTIKTYKNGTLDITATSGSIGTTTVNTISLGYPDSIAAVSMSGFLDDIYIDNDSTNSDTGDIRVTAKLPASDNVNNFNTTVGAAQSAGNRHNNVNERPLSETNGWEETANNSQVAENYGIQASSAGDVNISGNTYVGHTAWIWAKKGSTISPAIGTGTTNAARGGTATTTLRVPTGSGTITTAVGDLVVVAFADQVGGSAPTIADSRANSWTALENLPQTNNIRLSAWFSVVASGKSGTTSYTITFGSSNLSRAASVETFKGFTASPLDVQPNANTGASGTTLSGAASGTLAQANEFVIGLFGQASATTPTTSTETGIRGTNAGGTASTGSAVGITWRTVNSTSTVTPQATGAATGAYVGGTASFKATNSSAAESTTITDNGSNVGITLTTTSALYANQTTSASYPVNAATVGMQSTGAAPETFLYEAGVLIGFIGAPVPEYALLALPLAIFAPKAVKSFQEGTLVDDIFNLISKMIAIINGSIIKLALKLVQIKNKLKQKRRRQKQKF